MKSTYLLFLSTLLFHIFFAALLLGSEGNDFYSQVLLYGTDTDIAEAFSRVHSSLEEEVNSLAIQAFQEKHEMKVYRSLVQYIWTTKFEVAHDVLVGELNREADEDYLEAVILALGSLGNPDSLEPLVSLYRTEGLTARIKKAVVSAWGDIGDSRIEDTLIRIVEDQREAVEVRSAAVLSLGSVGGEKAFSVLKKVALNTYERKSLRMYAAHGMGKIGGEDALEVLGVLLEDETHEVAEYAVTGLTMIESSKKPELLMEALRSDYDKVRYYAAQELADMRYRPALDILRFKAQYDRNEAVRQQAQRAIDAIQDEQ